MAKNFGKSFNGLLLEAIAHPTDGFDIVGRIPQFFTQRHNFHIHGPVWQESIRLSYFIVWHDYLSTKRSQ